MGVFREGSFGAEAFFHPTTQLETRIHQKSKQPETNSWFSKVCLLDWGWKTCSNVSTGRTVNDVVFLRMLQVQHAQHFQIFCLASLEVIFIRFVAQLHSAHMLQPAACVLLFCAYWPIQLGSMPTQLHSAHMLQAAACVHYVAGQRIWEISLLGQPGRKFGKTTHAAPAACVEKPHH